MKTWSDLQKTHSERCAEIRAEIEVCAAAFNAFAEALRTHLVEEAGCPSEFLKVGFSGHASMERVRSLFVDLEMILRKPFGIRVELLLREDGSMLFSLNPRREDLLPSSPADVAVVAAQIMDQFDSRIRGLSSRTADGLPTELHA